MANSYYNVSGSPVTGSTGASAVMRSEFVAVQTGFSLLPSLTENGGCAVIVNGPATALTTTVGTLALAGNFATTGAFSTTLAQQGSTTLTLPATSDTLVGRATTDTLTNKTLTAPVISGTITGTYTIGGSPTISGATLSGSTLSGTTTLSGPVTATGQTVTGGSFSGITLSGTTTLSGPVTATGQTVTGGTFSGATLTTSTFNGNTFTTGTGTLTIGAGKTLTVNNSLILAGTDSTTMTFPGTSATIARTDAANTFTGTQTIGALVATTFNGNTFTTGTGTLTIAAAKTLTASNSLTLAGTDTTTMTFPTTSATIARTDAANTFTGVQTMTSPAITPPAFTGAFSGTYSLGGTPTINVAAAVGGTWTAAATWTLPAHTLAGTVSGGGNQINNVVIGAVTPLAGTFTTLTATGFPPRSYLAGLGLSTAGGSGTMSIAAGVCTSDDQTTLMTLAAFGKTTSAWAVGSGNGGIDTGAIANTTLYHFYVIERTDTAVVDVLFSLSATTPTLPANYTKQRRIGSGLTDGSAHWVAFSQNEEEFLWAAPVLDVNALVPADTNAHLAALTVPTGVKVMALFDASLSRGTGDLAVILSSPDQNDIAASAGTASTISAINASTNTSIQARLRTNTSAQIRYRASATTGNLYIDTKGWMDTRGRFS